MITNKGEKVYPLRGGNGVRAGDTAKEQFMQSVKENGLSLYFTIPVREGGGS